MLARPLALLVALLAAVAFSQLPEFSQQYRQRIGGAIDELARIVARFEAHARAEGLDAARAMERLRTSAEPVARRQGDAAAEDRRRLASLQDQRRTMANAGAFGRVAAMTTQADPQLARATWVDFEPAVPVTFEGLAFALAGFLAGWVAVTGPAAGIRRWRERRRLRRAPARS